ncbi:carboxypeptidase-like regulatory domain-containing protein [Pedobacter cryoconitis]|uniref:Carboxypeptidase-like protein n=1 Tax=Pedobacter cryoconitis TaxID=188932 RepID=A0A327SU16_9SPHI|nr:carboxypeptidase-like regulatory domain-containing protein [Pedobacter cryoconitis]RAJ29097.1 carboxypeptidase-like protein [Pedobacter cryoconitis]
MKKVALSISLLALFAILIFSLTASSPAAPVYYSIAARECMLHVTVVDEESNAFPGATVSLKELHKDTITNADGVAALMISRHSDMLVVSFAGYQTQMIKVIRGNTKPYKVKLYPAGLLKD